MDDARKTGMLCPSCKVDLAMTDRQGVEVDYCPNCRGVWLDRGELDKIIDRSSHVERSGGMSGDSRPDWSDDHRYRKEDKYGRKRKRKSFLEDMFDFG